MNNSHSIKTIPNALFFASVEEMVAEGRRVEMTVRGFSMRPFLRNGRDVVVLAPIGTEELEVGMVVLFRYRGGHILHRLSRIEGGELTFDGDGNYRQVERAEVGDVVAYVVAVKPEGRPQFEYGSGVWRRKSRLSIARKWCRTVALDVKRKILKNK